MRLGAEDQDVFGLDVLYQLEVAIVVHPAAPQGVQILQRDDKSRESGGYILYWIVVVQVGSFEVEHAGNGGWVQGLTEGGLELAHPEDLAEGHGDVTGFQVQGHSLYWVVEYLVLDHVRRTQCRVAGERHLPARRKDADIVAPFDLSLR